MPYQVRASPEFDRAYKKLPERLRLLLKARGKLFEENPFHPMFRAHKLDGALSEVWSFSIDYRHRVLFRFLTDQDILLLAIGDHSMYRKKRD